MLNNSRDNFTYPRGTDERGSSSSEIDRPNGAMSPLWEHSPEIYLAEQRIDVLPLWYRGDRIGVEVAVRTLLKAEWDVYIDCKRLHDFQKIS